MDEIKRRTQRPEESIGIYLAVMSALFRRLTCPVSEAARLKIILKNLSPFYQPHLVLIDVHSIDHLRTVCRKLEEKRLAVESFQLPSRKNALEPDLACVCLRCS